MRRNNDDSKCPKNIPYWDIDEPIRDLCVALNAIEGIKTTESCCGHGNSRCQIWLKFDKLETIYKFLHFCMNHEFHWDLCFETGDPDLYQIYEGLPVFRLQTVDIYDEYIMGLMALNLADRIHEHLSDLNTPVAEIKARYDEQRRRINYDRQDSKENS